MRKGFLLFVLKIAVFSAAVWVLFYFLKGIIPAKFFYHNVGYIIALFFFITLAFHAGMLKSSSAGNRSVVVYFMSATAIKLFMYVGVIIFYAILKTGHLVSFVTTFLMVYMLFSVFETATVYFLFKGKNKLDANK